MYNHKDIPESITIGPVTYQLVVDAQRTQDADITFGWTDIANTQLIFNPNQHVQQMRDTILHETLHVLMDQMGVGKGGDEALLNHDQEERLVHTLATLLLDTLRRNKDVVEYLLS